MSAPVISPFLTSVTLENIFNMLLLAENKSNPPK